MSDLKKFRFVDKFQDAQITIPVVRKTINKHNATDADIEYLLKKYPGKFDHNFELVGAKPNTENKFFVFTRDTDTKKVEAKAYPSDEPNEYWTVEQLKAYAEDHGIDLGRSKKEASILKKIAEHNG